MIYTLKPELAGDDREAAKSAVQSIVSKVVVKNKTGMIYLNKAH